MDIQGLSPSDQSHGQRVIRKLTARWKQILLLWLLLSGASILAVYQLVQPTYIAVSSLRIEPRQADLFGAVRDGFVDLRAIEPFVRVQAESITEHRVLSKAIGMPHVANLPSVKRDPDRLSDLRRKLTVEVKKDSFLILVSLECSDPSEAAAIVNAVVEAYMNHHSGRKPETDPALRNGLLAQLAKLESDIKKKMNELKALYGRGLVDPSRLAINFIAASEGDDRSQLNADQRGAKSDRKFDTAIAGIDRQLAEAGASLREAEDDPSSAPSLNDDEIQAVLVKRQLDILMKQEEQTRAKLQELDFRDGQEPFRVILVEPADVPKVPSTSDRWRYMATALVGIPMVLVGLFLILPSKS